MSSRPRQFELTSIICLPPVNEQKGAFVKYDFDMDQTIVNALREVEVGNALCRGRNRISVSLSSRSHTDRRPESVKSFNLR
jgi:hypothetical protein